MCIVGILVSFPYVSIAPRDLIGLEMSISQVIILQNNPEDIP